MQKDTILYIHGIGGGENSKTSERLRAAFPECEVYAPELPVSPREAMSFLDKICDENRYDIVVAASLGAFYAMYLHCGLTFLINPAMFAADDIPKSIGYGTHEFCKERSDGAKTYEIDDAFIAELREIQCPFENFEVDPVTSLMTYAIFGLQDDVVNHRDDFSRFYDKSHMVTADFGHRMTDKVFDEVLDPLIRKAMDDYIKGLIV